MDWHVHGVNVKEEERSFTGRYCMAFHASHNVEIYININQCFKNGAKKLIGLKSYLGNICMVRPGGRACVRGNWAGGF